MSSILRGIVFLFSFLFKIFGFLLKPIYKILRRFLKKILPPIYLFFWKRKKVTEKFHTPIIFIPLKNKHLLFTLIFLLCFSILFNNSQIKNISAENLNKKSLLYKIAQGDEFEEDIVEGIDFSDIEKIDYERLARADQVDFADLPDVSLGKQENITGEVNEQNLLAQNSFEGLAANTLQKNSIPETTSSPTPRSNIQEYVVEGGDTISTIAQKFGVSINTILWANDLSGLSIIRPGDKLSILPTTGVLHKVKSGDTLSAIAKKYGTDLDKILNYNKLIDDAQLSVNQMLIIPDGEIKTTYVASAPSPSFSNVFKSPSSEKNETGFIWPTVSRIITQYYHWRHHAIDIGGKLGAPEYASKSGKVIKAGWGTGYGNYVVIDHGGGVKTLYAHMTTIYVKTGDYVNQGDVIGALGSTGWSTGPHLHFEIIINGVQVNPLSYL